MAVLDDELQQDLIDDARERDYMRQHLSDELNRTLPDDALQTVIEAACEYYATSGVLESGGGKDIEVDASKVADYVLNHSADNLHHLLTYDVVLQLVLLDMDFNWT